MGQIRITEPVIITPRLLPGVRVGDGLVSVQRHASRAADGRYVFSYFIDTPRGEFGGSDLTSPRPELQEALETALTFLHDEGMASLRARTYREAAYESHLFPREVVEWAGRHADEISMLLADLDTGEDHIEEIYSRNASAPVHVPPPPADDLGPKREHALRMAALAEQAIQDAKRHPRDLPGQLPPGYLGAMREDYKKHYRVAFGEEPDAVPNAGSEWSRDVALDLTAAYEDMIQTAKKRPQSPLASRLADLRREYRTHYKTAFEEEPTYVPNDDRAATELYEQLLAAADSGVRSIASIYGRTVKKITSRPGEKTRTMFRVALAGDRSPTAATTEPLKAGYEAARGISHPAFVRADETTGNVEQSTWSLRSGASFPKIVVYQSPMGNVLEIVLDRNEAPNTWTANGAMSRSRWSECRPGTFKAEQVVYEPNRVKWDSYSGLAGYLFVGTKVGNVEKFSPSQIVEAVRKYLRTTLERGEDSSFIVQTGVYTHEADEETKTPAYVVEETSVQVIIFDGYPPSEPAKFIEDMQKLGEELAERFEQETVIVDVRRGNVSVGTFGMGK